MASAPTADTARVLAFRLAGHNLARRLPPGSLVEATAACGIPDYPPGAVTIALGARVADLIAADLDRALGVERTLLQVRSVRTVPLVFPAADVGVFTTAITPDDEESCRHFIRGAEPALEKVGIAALELVDLVSEEAMAALDGRELPFRHLSAGLTERVSRRLSPEQLAGWRSPSWYASDQSLGEALVHFALYVCATRGLICYAARLGREARFARMDQWLARLMPPIDRAASRAELVRRYLRAYGPSTAERFGEWAGISTVAAAAMWGLLEHELLPVGFRGGTAWLLEHDLGAFESPPDPDGVRLLPPYDAYLAQRDREVMIPDASVRRRIWRAAGGPGVVLSAGRLVGTWRARKVGRRLAVAVEPFVPLGEAEHVEVASEAVLVARLRGCEVADVELVG